MTDATYHRIAQIHNQLLEDEENPLTIRFKENSEKYWKLAFSLPKEQWQIVNDCFCCFHAFYMTVISIAMDGEE